MVSSPEEDAPGFTPIRPVEVRPAGAPTRAASASAPQTPQVAQEAPGVSARTVLIAALVLIIGGLGLMAGLQWLNRPPSESAAPAAGENRAPEAAEADEVATPTVSATPAPWDNPQALQARARAQDLAESVAERIIALQEQAVERWASDAFAAAQGQRDGAEAQMRERNFIAAAERYTATDTALAALQERVPGVLREAVNAADTALQAGDAAAAKTAVDLATAVDADADAVKTVAARLATLPEVMKLIRAADVAEQRGDLAAAEQGFRDALAQDGEMQRARDGLARVSGVQAQARFQRVMGEALGALDAGRFDAADAALKRAEAIRPGDAAVRAAQTRLAAARRQQRIDKLMQQAGAAVAAERWADAVTHYQAVLNEDANRAEAQDGLRAAQPRAALAAQLKGLIDQPSRLYAPAVQADAERALTTARAISPAGPQLRRQISELQTHLKAARTPVTVRLTSDQNTEVTIYRIGDQGRFADKQLQLLPGRYIAVGVRRGYRDARVEFEVAPGQPLTVAVRAEEAL